LGSHKEETDAFALEPGFALADADLFFIVIISFLFLPDVKMSAIFCVVNRAILEVTTAHAGNMSHKILEPSFLSP